MSDADIEEIELLRYVGGEVTSTRAADIERHALDCSRCARRLSEIRALWNGIAEGDPELDAVDLLARTRERLRVGTPPVRARRARLLPVALTGALAAGALVWVGSRADDE